MSEPGDRPRVGRGPVPSLPPPPPLAALAVPSPELRTAVRRVVDGGRDGAGQEERLAAAARLGVEDARRQGLLVEQMLVTLKREWAELPEVRQLDSADARELLSRLVTWVIRAYYAPPAGQEAPESRRDR